MSATLDPQAAKLTARLNLPCEPRLALHRESAPGSGYGAGAGVTPFHFSAEWPRPGAALHSLTWMLAALESYCAPVQDVKLEYPEGGGVRATVYVGGGWVMPEGMHDFLSLAVLKPRVAPMEWVLEVRPWYTTVSATAVADPGRFEEIGMQVRGALTEAAAWFLPEMRCPCASFDAGMQQEAAAKAPALLQRLRDGTARFMARATKGGAA